MYSPPKGFRGFVWEPSSEHDVVVMFGRRLASWDPPLAVEYSWTPFPDCTAIDTSTGERVAIEFEFRSSSFRSHLSEWRQLRLSDPSSRWWVVCWHDDLDEKAREDLSGLEVVGLRDWAWEHDQRHEDKFVLNWYHGDPDDSEQRFAWRSAGLSTVHREIIDRLRACSPRVDGFEVHWPTRPDLPWFTVRHCATGVECLKVHANGRLGFPFSRWGGVTPSRKTALLQQLDVALATHWFRGREQKKKGCDASWLLAGGKAEVLLAALNRGLNGL